MDEILHHLAMSIMGYKPVLDFFHQQHDYFPSSLDPALAGFESRWSLWGYHWELLQPWYRLRVVLVHYATLLDVSMVRTCILALMTWSSPSFPCSLQALFRLHCACSQQCHGQVLWVGVRGLAYRLIISIHNQWTGLMDSNDRFGKTCCKRKPFANGFELETLFQIHASPHAGCDRLFIPHFGHSEGLPVGCWWDLNRSACYLVVCTMWWLMEISSTHTTHVIYSHPSQVGSDCRKVKVLLSWRQHPKNFLWNQWNCISIGKIVPLSGSAWGKRSAYSGGPNRLWLGCHVWSTFPSTTRCCRF